MEGLNYYDRVSSFFVYKLKFTIQPLKKIWGHHTFNINYDDWMIGWIGTFELKITKILAGEIINSENKLFLDHKFLKQKKFFKIEYLKKIG